MRGAVSQGGKLRCGERVSDLEGALADKASAIQGDQVHTEGH